MRILGVTASSFELYAAFESIATATPSGTTVVFSSIPSTYKHLQVRMLCRSNGSFARDVIAVRLNGDTDSNYSWHRLRGDGTAVDAGGSANQTYMQFGNIPANTTTANIFGTAVLDIHDYADTSKNKTIRTLAGHDANGSGYIQLDSGLWRNTNAVTSITIYPESATGWVSGTNIALYGIKGA